VSCGRDSDRIASVCRELMSEAEELMSPNYDCDPLDKGFALSTGTAFGLLRAVGRVLLAELEGPRSDSS